MGERKRGMSREEIAVWLEETASQLRTGTLMVDGESIAVPADTGAAVKTRSKDGQRRLKLQLRWEEPSEKASKKTAKKAKKASKNVQRETAGGGDVAHESGESAAGNHVGGTGSSGERASGERGSVRDYESHVLVCKGGDCSKKGGKETKKAIKSELRSEGISRDVRIDSVDCLGMCKQGPNVIVYPEGAWYLGLKKDEVPEVVEEHLKGKEPVQRLAAERRAPKQKAKK